MILHITSGLSPCVQILMCLTISLLFMLIFEPNFSYPYLLFKLTIARNLIILPCETTVSVMA